MTSGIMSGKRQPLILVAGMRLSKIIRKMKRLK